MANNSKLSNQSEGLKQSFTPLGMWAFSIGTSIGWGSFIVTCNTYLQKSGVLGTVFGLLLGMAVIFVITWNLQYMIRKAPDAGGIYTFTKKVSGNELGFLALWFVLLTYLAILWANITSLPLFARFFLGDTFQFGFQYEIFGYKVWLGEALLSIAAIIIVGFLCTKSSKLPNHIMVVAALVFALGFTVCAVIAIAKHNSSFSYEPFYTEGSSSLAQIVRIAAISPWAFIGFENISHFSEEYKFPVKKVRGILISSVVITTVLYLFVSLLSVSAYPPEYASWLDYIRDMGNLQGIKAVPAFYAANYYLGQAGVTLLMFALFGVILTSLIGNMLALSRLLYAAGREGEAPHKLSELNRRGIPSKAISAIVAVSVVIPFLGRTAIGWIVDVTTLGGTLIYGLISYSVYRHAKQARSKTEEYTGIFGLVLMTVFVLLLMIPGLLPFDAMETESYVLFIFWAVLGLFYFRVLIKRNHGKVTRQRIVVWVILLVLVLFASVMWVSRATETAANTAVENIFEYHQLHPDHDSSEKSIEEREAYLHQQAQGISSTNTLYSAVSLGLFILCITIMLDNYKETEKLGKRLSKADRTAYSRINALSGSYICIYVVDPKTERYREISTTPGFDKFALPKEGIYFFETTRKFSLDTVFPDDTDRFLSVFTKENVLEEIKRSGIFSLSYRLVVDGKPTYVQLRAAMVEESEGDRIIVGINNVDADVRQEEEYARRLAQAQSKANLDALTGVKNKHAYLDAERRLDRRIAEHRDTEFAIIIVDVNGLKRINDTHGHHAGDQYLKDACSIICKIFKHSPVFRVGGDEFAIIAEGSDYKCLEDLITKVNEHNEKAMQEDGIIIACGMAKYNNDARVASVFDRADTSMYENKNILKSTQNTGEME